MRNFDRELVQIEVMELLGFNMEQERAELKQALIESIMYGEKEGK